MPHDRLDQTAGLAEVLSAISRRLWISEILSASAVALALGAVAWMLVTRAGLAAATAAVLVVVMTMGITAAWLSRIRSRWTARAAAAHWKSRIPRAAMSLSRRRNCCGIPSAPHRRFARECSMTPRKSQAGIAARASYRSGVRLSSPRPGSGCSSPSSRASRSAVHEQGFRQSRRH